MEKILMNLEWVTPEIVKLLGIITYSIFLITLLGGLFRKKLAPLLGKNFLRIHMILGIAAIILASFHGFLVLMLY